MLLALRPVGPTLLGMAMGAFCSPALAQPLPEEWRERIEVTGSHIRRVDFESPAVVQVITRDDIARSGAIGLAELLRELPAMAGGSVQDFNQGTGFQRGNQTISLRGLGSVATLVLLNGRRIPSAPYGDPNLAQGSSFNLNTIPLGAIERIDVLKDGASAIYGSDAIAGVVNIILRNDYQGAEASWSHWQKLESFDRQNYRTEQVSATLGYGNLARDRYNVLMVAEWLKRDPVWIRDSGNGVRNDDYRRLLGRNAPNGSAFTSPPNFRRESVRNSGIFDVRLPGDTRCPLDNRVAVGGTFECRVNQFDWAQMRSELERQGVLSRAVFQLSPAIATFVEVLFSRTETTFLSSPPTLGDTLVPWLDSQGRRFTYALVLPVGHPDNPANAPVGLRYRFVDLGESYLKVRHDFTRAVGGLNGTLGAWDWETAVLFSRDELAERRAAFLNYPALVAAINGATYRFGASDNSPAVLAALRPELAWSGDSKVASWDFKVTREIARWRAGPVALAVGVEARHENFSIIPDARQAAGEALGLVGAAPFDARRTVWSAFSEVSLPLPARVEAQLAARADRYSDYGNSFTPKLGLKWNAAEALALRGTYAKGFRAPSLFQSRGGDVQAITTLLDPVRCPTGSPQTAGPNDDCSFRPALSTLRSQPETGAERSSSHTLGFIVSPASNYSLSVERWYVHHIDFITTFAPETLLLNESRLDPAQGSINRNPDPSTWIPGIPNSGPILQIVRNFGNFGDVVARGIDLDASARWNFPTWKRFGVAANATYYDKLLWRRARDGAYISGLGNFYVYESPRFRGQLTATWDHDKLSALIRYNYVGSWAFGEPTSPTTVTSAPLRCYLEQTQAGRAVLEFLGRCYVEAFETWDVGFAWTGVANLKLGILVKNVTNKAAPLDPNSAGLGFNPTFHNPYGRYLQLSLTYKFR
jgi:iron complex outermembrane receptor protein